MRIHDGIGIRDHQGVELRAAPSQLVDCPSDRCALSGLTTCSLETIYPAAPGQRGCAIIASVGHDHDAGPVPGILDLVEAAECLGEAGFFVMRGDQDQEPAARSVQPGSSRPRR